ncbi:hypothetical protein V6N13_043001 [Hibiscus sabdariffa]
MSMTLFYSAGDESHPGKSSNHLTNSLSKILTHYYPFVGRLNHDGLTIDCNDEGVVFVEARVSSEVPFVVDEPENEVLQRLLPLNPHDHQAPSSVGDAWCSSQLFSLAVAWLSVFASVML